jgi:aspartate carbamoyltransferase catalytic subunit
MSLYATVPVINAGDGGRAYPVRTLSDIATVWQYKRHVSNMKIGFMGDFSDNAYVKGLLQCLNLYKGNEFYFISVNGKPLNPDYISLMDKREKPFVVVNDLFDVLPQLDVLYLTRISEDNFDGEVEYETKKSNFILNEKMLLTAKPDLIILHPMPRGEEISPEIDGDPRAVYFDSVNIFNDVCVAIYTKTVSNKAMRTMEPDYEEDTHDEVCSKENCITSAEKYLPSLFYETTDGRLICKYCGQELIKKDE